MHGATWENHRLADGKSERSAMLDRPSNGCESGDMRHTAVDGQQGDKTSLRRDRPTRETGEHREVCETRTGSQRDQLS